MRKNANCPREIVDITAKNICSAISATGNTIVESLLQRQLGENVIGRADALRYLAYTRNDINLLVEPLMKLSSDYGRIKYLKVTFFFQFVDFLYKLAILGHGTVRYSFMQSGADPSELPSKWNI